MTIPKLLSSLLDNAETSRIAIADIHGNGVTYSELRYSIEQTQIWLRETGIAPGDTIATYLRNGPETAALLIALLSYCRVAPINPAYTAAEISFVLGDVKARALITTAGAHEAIGVVRESAAGLILLEPGEHRPGTYTLHNEGAAVPKSAGEPTALHPNDMALLLHTSGTTSRPKLVPLTHTNLWLSSHSVAKVLQLEPRDRCLSIMPLFHIHGLVAGLLASLTAGATVCCAPGFQGTSFFSWLNTSQATWYTAVPTMHQTILARAGHNSHAIEHHRLRLIRSSSAPLYPNVWEQLEKVFRVPVLNSYGMTEAAHQISSVPLPGGSSFRNTVGATSGLKIAVMNDKGCLLAPGETGEIVLQGEQITSGYLEPAGANQSAFHDGWFRTGDEGVLTAEGLLTLTGRLKEMINSGGEKISPYEVEEALLLHPGVAQAVAFSAPHHLLGEQVAAAIVLREGATVPERELLQFAGQRMARAKLPRLILFVAEIPPGPTGKLQRIGLAKRLGVAEATASG